MSDFDRMNGRQAAAAIMQMCLSAGKDKMREIDENFDPEDGEGLTDAEKFMAATTMLGIAEAIREIMDKEDEDQGDTFTFTAEGDLGDLMKAAKDINVRRCPWFGFQDKYGNRATYIRGDYGEDIGYLVMDVPECWDVDLVIISNGSGPLATAYRKEGEE